MLQESYTVITAKNGEEGIRLAAINNPDVILCDVMMPVLDGFDVLSAVRADKTLQYTPFVFITAKADRESTLRGFNEGADYYLTKPFTVAELLDSVQTALRKKRSINRLVGENREEVRSTLLRKIPDQFGNLLNGIIGLAQIAKEELESDNFDKAKIIENIDLLLSSCGKLYGLLWSYFRSIEKK